MRIFTIVMTVALFSYCFDFQAMGLRRRINKCGSVNITQEKKKSVELITTRCMVTRIQVASSGPTGPVRLRDHSMVYRYDPNEHIIGILDNCFKSSLLFFSYALATDSFRRTCHVD